MTEIYDDRYCNSDNYNRYIKQRAFDVAPTLDVDNDSEQRNIAPKPSLWISALAGGAAGLIVDFTLYPLDTLRTRHQSKEGFIASGGFKKVYKGIIPVLLCSAPASALFFSIYNTLINTMKTDSCSLPPYVYIIAASTAELVCSSFRIPMEIVKQRKQTTNAKSTTIIQKTFKEEGFLGFYRGFSSTIIREIPFACIQYPLWEYLIKQLIFYGKVEELTALQIAYCGAAAGATAAVLTTPVDVVKTRIMLAEKEKIEAFKPNIYINFVKEIFRDRGFFGFFAGVFPRTLWIMFGGFIYFGAYEQAKLLFQNKWFYFIETLKVVHDETPSYLDEKLDNFCTEKVCHYRSTNEKYEGDSVQRQK